MMTDEVKEKIKDKSTDEIKMMIRNSEIEIPADKTGRDEFLHYASKTPEERKILDEPEGSDAKDSSKGESEVVTAEGEGAGDDSQKQWFEKRGYATEEEADTAISNQRDLNIKLQSQIDQINAKGDQRGRELKKVKDRNKELVDEISELKEKVTPEKPQKPVKPNSKDYEDGRLDEKYLEAMEQYDDEKDLYNEQLLEYERYENQKTIETLKVEMAPKESDVPDVVDKPAASNWDKFYDQDVPAFQKEYGLETDVTVRVLSENGKKLDSKDPKERKKAEAFLATVSTRDKERYTKVREVMENTYTFGDKGPVFRYNKWKTALEDCELVGPGKPIDHVEQSSLSADEEKRLREEQQKKNESTVEAIPGNKLSGKDELSSSTKTKDEKEKRLKDLIADYNNAINMGVRAQKEFQNSPEFQEINNLMKELKMPNRLLFKVR